ncbi:hypothetical protein [Pseudoclavibacter albus]|nr:hypothetical protein [Pseudoclavibacter alba]
MYRQLKTEPAKLRHQIEQIAIREVEDDELRRCPTIRAFVTA